MLLFLQTRVQFVSRLRGEVESFACTLEADLSSLELEPLFVVLHHNVTIVLSCCIFMLHASINMHQLRSRCMGECNLTDQSVLFHVW